MPGDKWIRARISNRMPGPEQLSQPVPGAAVLVARRVPMEQLARSQTAVPDCQIASVSLAALKDP